MSGRRPFRSSASRGVRDAARSPIGLDVGLDVGLDAGRASDPAPKLGLAEAWFASRGWTPHAFQHEAWERSARGESGLVHVPTGSGKTYAAYLGALETAQLGGSKTPYESLIARAVGRSLDIYLDAAGGGGAGRTAPAPGDKLLKIGQLAQAVGETVPTIRHWTKLGLLEVAQTTPAGYQLFAADAIDRCRRIQSLKGHRHTLAEIRTELSGT